MPGKVRKRHGIWQISQRNCSARHLQLGEMSGTSASSTWSSASSLPPRLALSFPLQLNPVTGFTNIPDLAGRSKQLSNRSCWITRVELISLWPHSLDRTGTDTGTGPGRRGQVSETTSVVWRWLFADLPSMVRSRQDARMRFVYGARSGGRRPDRTTDSPTRKTSSETALTGAQE